MKKTTGKTKKIFWLLSFMFLLASCGDKAIPGTSDEKITSFVSETSLSTSVTVTTSAAVTSVPGTEAKTGKNEASSTSVFSAVTDTVSKNNPDNEDISDFPETTAERNTEKISENEAEPPQTFIITTETETVTETSYNQDLPDPEEAPENQTIKKNEDGSIELPEIFF